MDGSLLLKKYLGELKENGHDMNTASPNDKFVALIDAVAPYLGDIERKSYAESGSHGKRL